MKRRSSISAWLTLAALGAAGAQGVRDELVVGLGPYGYELHPYRSVYSHDMQILNALYEGLFSYDPETMEPVRAHAASFAKSPDGLSWTFTLRDGLRWSDGSAIVARDYVESWLYLLHPDTKADFAVFLDAVKGARDYRTGRNDDPGSVGVSAQDDRTLIVELESPTAYLTRLLCHASFAPVPPSMRVPRGAALGASGAPPQVSGGPYRLVSAAEGEIVMERDPLYWDAPSVAIPRLRFLFLEDEAEATGLYNDGEIHWLMDMADTELLWFQDDIQFGPNFGTGYYFWNANERPWNDARIRRALALLIPWERIRSEERYFAPTATLILPFAGYESPAGIEARDAAEAKALLARAGYADPSRLPTLRLAVPGSPSHRENAELIAAAWAEVGIRAELVFPTPGQSMDALREAGWDLSFSSWIGDFADPAAFLLMWTSDSSLNQAGYRSRLYDELVRESSATEGKERLAALARAEAKLLADAIVLPAYHSLSFDVINLELVRGWYVNPMDVHPFKALSFGQPKARPFVAALQGE